MTQCWDPDICTCDFYTYVETYTSRLLYVAETLDLRGMFTESSAGMNPGALHYCTFRFRASAHFILEHSLAAQTAIVLNQHSRLARLRHLGCGGKHAERIIYMQAVDSHKPM